MAASSITVTENGRGRYQQTVRAGQHELIADEPASMGGGDAGPAPFDYLLTALGACTSMTLRMYAERKALPLTGIEVELTHDRIEVDGSPRDRIRRRITLGGDLTPEQRQRMLEIAGKCPIARALGQPLLLEAELTA